ncbi:hypothetical protein SBA3_3920027 [Candidatus Sulfopaludibacter sp. SbA3]|nr:hypothetical protein SBA3_3920027 [Candidatus Sulfopaludibacter sp. SbA3]
MLHRGVSPLCGGEDWSPVSYWRLRVRRLTRIGRSFEVASVKPDPSVGSWAEFNFAPGGAWRSAMAMSRVLSRWRLTFPTFRSRTRPSERRSVDGTIPIRFSLQ